MAAVLKVPTLFTAIDRISSVVSRISRSVGNFANVAEIGVARANRVFRSFTPVIGETGKQLLETAKAAALAGAIIGGIAFSGKAIMDYEKSLASFRTIVSDLSNKEFGKFRAEIARVANDSKGLASTIDVAASFEKIAGLNSKFAETANGIGLVSKAAITLSKASGDELGTSAENLVGIMNQFSLGANQADRTINVLAAGQAVGAASITQTSEAFKNFGSVASSSNISLEQSVGLIQTLAKYSVFGAEAGTKLRGATLQLQKAGAGYTSGQFKINDALDQVSKKYDSLRTQRQKDALLLKVFGAENISVGKILLNNRSIIDEYTRGVTGTSEAQKAAEINANTLGGMIEQVQKKWVTYVTTTDQANSGLITLKNALGYVIENFASIISIGIKVVTTFAAIKAIILVTQAALWAYNLVIGANAVLTGTMTEALLVNKSAMIGAKIAAAGAATINWILGASVKALTAAQWLLNIALDANPIGLIIIAIAALIGLITVIIKYWDDWGAALAVFLGPLGMIISLIQSFRRNWDMISKSFKEGGIIAGIKAIGKVIFDALLQPMEQLLSIIGKFTGMKWATDAAANLNMFRAGLGVTMEGNNPEDQNPKPVLGTPQMKSDEITRNTFQKNSLDVNFNDPNNRISSTKMSGPLEIPIKISSTQGAN